MLREYLSVLIFYSQYNQMEENHIEEQRKELPEDSCFSRHVLVIEGGRQIYNARKRNQVSSLPAMIPLQIDKSIN